MVKVNVLVCWEHSYSFMPLSASVVASRMNTRSVILPFYRAWDVIKMIQPC